MDKLGPIVTFVVGMSVYATNLIAVLAKFVWCTLRGLKRDMDRL